MAIHVAMVCSSLRTQALQPQGDVASFSYIRLLPYDEQTLAALSSTQEPALQIAMDMVQPNATGVCLVHVGKTGGGSLISGLARPAAKLCNVIVVHAALRQPVLLQSRQTWQLGCGVDRFAGPFVEGLPALSACVGTGRVVMWVRDPVARFLSTWHASICFEAACSNRRAAVWETAVAMGLVPSKDAASGMLDLNLVLDELARRDGARLPGNATFTFLLAVEHGVSGVAAYLPNCSVAFLRRHPLHFVGRTEHMTEDWQQLFGGGSLVPMTQEHHFVQEYPTKQLSGASLAWLRAFYDDDYLCMQNLHEVGLLSEQYVHEEVSARRQYDFWPALTVASFQRWKQGATQETTSGATQDVMPLPTAASMARMRRRANTLKRCNASQLLTEGNNDAAAMVFDGVIRDRAELRKQYADEPAPFNWDEAWMCDAAQLAFAHVFKSAGSTIMDSMARLCNSTFGEEAHGYRRNKGCDSVSPPDGPRWNCGEEMPPHVADYTWFTFVREPLSRFASGIFELGKRSLPCVKKADKVASREQDSGGDGLALQVLERCVLVMADEAWRKAHLRATVDEHLMLQTSVLMGRDAEVTPLLSFVGAVETMNDDWPALVATFFGAEAGAEVGAGLRNGTLHLRDQNSDQYAEPTDQRFRVNITTPSVRRALAAAYRVDEVCLGYDGSSTSHVEGSDTDR